MTTAGRGSLALRIGAACVLVALLAVGVAAAVSARLVSATARDVARTVLAQEADVVAAQLADGQGGLRRAADVLRGQGIAIVVITAAGRDTADDAVAAAAVQRAGADGVLTGRSVSAVVAVAGRPRLVEARAAGRGGFALVQADDSAAVSGPTLRRNLAFALLAGIAVAVLVGLAVAGLLARPLRRTAAAAHILRTGRRDVRVPVSGPSEIAEVAGAVNELADALAHSEARQRAFLLSVSHELRTPLTAVSGFAESLADGVVTGDDVPHAGRIVLREAHRLQRLVDDLMELARLEADDFRLDPVVVDLATVTTEAADVWRERARAVGVEFRHEVPAEPVQVLADPRRLRQVVDGLAENALRVTPAGAPLVIATGSEPCGAALEVRDGGPGLSAEDMAVAFTRGALHDRYRDRRPVGVGGIGLALVHGLVTRMGGSITVGRAPEGGASFRVVLPAPDEPTLPVPGGT